MRSGGEHPHPITSLRFGYQVKLERGPEEHLCRRQREMGQVRGREEVAGDLFPAS